MPKLKITEDSWRDKAFRKRYPNSLAVTDLAYDVLSAADRRMYSSVRRKFAKETSTEQWYALSVAILATLYNWKDK